MNHASPFSCNEEFAPVLRRQMEFYNHDPSSDKISKVKADLADVKGVMVHNIEVIPTSCVISNTLDENQTRKYWSAENELSSW